MATTQMEPNLDQWVSFCENLTPYQNFALIGLLFLRPQPPLSILPTSEIVTEGNARGAEKWSESRFRKLLLFYCEHYKKKEVEAAGELIDKSEAVKRLAPLLVSTLAVPVGVATAFLFWATGKRLDNWCKKYSRRKLNGQGKYTGDFDEKEVNGFFEVVYLPPIVEYIEDPAAYPLEGYKIKIKVDPETDGRLKVSTAKELNSIQFSFGEKRSHAFAFVDTKSTQDVNGRVDNVFHVNEDGPIVIRFTSTDIEVAPSRKP
ncbi:MAG: hypothetical protein QOF72_1000 [Blastocatellia bacterium]|jgi:hypothetical protein|nr:hypothetical protein [Blastocatellia bacterium]